MSESQEQIALFEWAALSKQKYPELALMHHIPNGSKRDAKTGAILKREGVKAGVPDICLPVARSGFHGLYIELKWSRNKPTAAQVEWIEALRKQGYLTAVCWSWVDAQRVILNYLEG